MPSKDLNFASWVPESDRQQIRKFFESIEHSENGTGPKKRRKLDVTEMDYHSQYLKSALWTKIKKRVLARDKNVCQCCGGHGNYVHHRDYSRETLLGESDSMLATVCSGCHNLIHFDDAGVKRSIEETDKAFLAGQRQTDIPEIDLDLRRKFRPPANYHRLTAVQIKLWNEERHKQRHAKWLKLHPNQPPKQPGGFFKPELWQSSSTDPMPPSAA